MALLGRTMLPLMFHGLASMGTALILFADTCVGLAGMLVRPDRYRRRQIVDALGRAILLPLPLTGALAAVLGVIFALLTGYALAIVPFEEVLLSVLRQSLIRQAVPLLVGLIVLGQAGLALAARLAAMAENGECDTVRSLGIAPTRWLLPAALLEFTVMAAVQFAFAIAISQLAAALVLLAGHGIPPAHYADALASAAARKDFWSGLARSETAALLTWLVVTTAGVNAAPGPELGTLAVRTAFSLTLLGLLVVAAVFTWLGA